MRTHRKLSAATAGAAALTLVLAACSGGSVAGDAKAADSDTASEVEVFTWWASGSEKLGLDAMVEVFSSQHPEVAFVDGAIAGGAGSAAKDLLESRLRADDPPDTFQAHVGAELSAYIDAGQLEDISDLYDGLGLREVFPTDLVDRLTVDGGIYSIPTNIHRSNVVWANPQVLEEAGLDPAAKYASLDDWFIALDAVEATGRTALSVATTWTQVHLLENVLLADLGAQAYSGLWDGSTPWEGADVTAALEDFETLMAYTNADRESLDWPDATQQVIDGQAAFTVMGDWAVAAFEEAGMVAGTDFVHFPVPGTAGVFNFLADSFTLPVGAGNPAGTRAWLETIASAEGQTAFNQVKGSIPARTDADPADFSAYQQTAIESFAQDTIVPSLAHGAAAPIATLNGVSDAVNTFTTGASDLTAFQSELAAAAAR